MKNHVSRRRKSSQRNKKDTAKEKAKTVAKLEETEKKWKKKNLGFQLDPCFDAVQSNAIPHGDVMINFRAECGAAFFHLT